MWFFPGAFAGAGGGLGGCRLLRRLCLFGGFGLVALGDDGGRLAADDHRLTRWGVSNHDAQGLGRTLFDRCRADSLRFRFEFCGEIRLATKVHLDQFAARQVELHRPLTTRVLEGKLRLILLPRLARFGRRSVGFCGRPRSLFRLPLCGLFVSSRAC